MVSTRRGLFPIAVGALVAIASPAFAQVVIQERVMPALKVEVIPARPHPNWSWVKGHWRWIDGRREWVWISGRWVEHAVPAMPELIVETPPPAPSPRHFWVRGHWVWEGNHWQWVRGHWVV
jgi:hypothetical protein